MTASEFSNEFDVLYNSITSNQAPGLDEYEKSVFLTKAQYEILKNYFNPKGNKYQEGFDDSEKRQIDFSTLVIVNTPPHVQNSSLIKFDNRSELFQMPSNILFVLNETATATDDSATRVLNIVPINFDNYSRIMSKAYKQPLKNQGWRLFRSAVGVDPYSEIIVGYNSTINDYKIRYVKRPKPIVLTNLKEIDSSLSIEGVSNVTDPNVVCELNESIHPEILQRAVELAKIAYMGDAKSIVELGQRSE